MCFGRLADIRRRLFIATRLALPQRSQDMFWCPLIDVEVDLTSSTYQLLMTWVISQLRVLSSGS